ncbi:MAG: hypothetical protein FWF60_00310 [Oscillospiraceae bacterium]|nr:hypothetical protein [Oscillospiraceae bacterium]
METEVAEEHAEEQPKHVEVVWASSKPKKKRPDAVKIVERVISLLLGPAVAIATLALAQNPKLNRKNMNYEQRALMGDIEAQMFLGDYNYQIGNIEKSIMYYSMVVDRPKLKTEQEREYYYMASSNISYVYLTKFGDETFALTYLTKGMRILAQYNEQSSNGDTLTKNYLLSALRFTNNINDDSISRYLEQSNRSLADGDSRKELYNNDSRFKLMIDYGLLIEKCDYYWFLDGKWNIGKIVLFPEQFNGFTQDDYERWVWSDQRGVIKHMKECGVRPELFQIAKGEEAPGVEPGDVLFNASSELDDVVAEHKEIFEKIEDKLAEYKGLAEYEELVEYIEMWKQFGAALLPPSLFENVYDDGMRFYNVYRELSKTDAYQYISYINSIES